MAGATTPRPHDQGAAITIPAKESAPPPADSQYRLLAARRFGPFFATQFLGALNDNVYKNALLVLMAYQTARFTTLDADTAVNLAAGLFVLPFFLFSATAGQLADKYDKARLIRATKLLEIAIMAVAAVGFWLQSSAVLIGALFFMGLQSALFSPAKYALIPQHLRPAELVGGNALVETGTFVAILIGTVIGGALAGFGEAGVAAVAAGVVVLAAAGWIASLRIPPAPAPAPDLRVDWNFLTQTWRAFALARQRRTVLLSILGNSWFWFYGALVLTQIPNYTKIVLGGTEGVVTLLLCALTVGIAAGSLACERLSAHKLELGLVPFGSIGLTVFGVDLAFAGPDGAQSGVTLAAFLAAPGGWRVLADFLLIGLFGGFYIVPLYAIIQARSDEATRARVISANNIRPALFMALAAVVAAAYLKAGLTIPQLFLAAALMNAAIAVFIYRLVPEFLQRFLVWLLVHTVYRLRIEGLEHLPAKGPAVIACNHVSYVDALIILAACPRPVRFVMYHRIFKLPVLNFVFRHTRAIPIAPAREDPDLLKRAYDEVARALEAGEVVGIFPEGALTADGEIAKFRPGIRAIVERTPVPVVPMALRGLWGSLFTRKHKGLGRLVPRKLFARVGLVVAPPMPPDGLTPEALQAQVSALRGAHP